MVIRRLIIILGLIAIIIFTGALGYRLIEGWSFSEALYMTIITISTVGFQEIKPLSQSGRVFTIFLILGGIAIITTGGSFIFSTIIEGTFGEILRRQRMEKKLSRIKDHFVICGLGAVGEDVILEFIQARCPFVLIDKREKIIEQFIRKFPDLIYIIGDATSDEILKKARIEHACGLIAVLGSDVENLYICLSARTLNPKLRIIARAIESESIDKLKKAGADYVFSPEKIGALRLAAAALRPAVTSFLDAILKGEYFNLQLDEIRVEAGSEIANKTLEQAKISKNIGIIIPAIKASKDGVLHFNPSSRTTIHPEDIFIVFGTSRQIKKLKQLCAKKK